MQQKLIQEQMQQRFALPPNWAAFTDSSSGQTYYYNGVTGETQWERPVYSNSQIAQIEEAREKEADEQHKEQALNNKHVDIPKATVKNAHLTREEKIELKKQEEEEFRRLVEESKEREKEELKSAPIGLGQWKVVNTPSKIYQRSEELKRQDEAKAKKERFLNSVLLHFTSVSDLFLIESVVKHCNTRVIPSRLIINKQTQEAEQSQQRMLVRQQRKKKPVQRLCYKEETATNSHFCLSSQPLCARQLLSLFHLRLHLCPLILRTSRSIQNCHTMISPFQTFPNRPSRPSSSLWKQLH